MNITGVFISRPVMTTLVMLGIVLFGVAGYRALPVSDLPNVDFPTLQVNANLPGASPETMAASVATPLERQFSTIPGLDSMTSTSSRGSTNVTLQFSLERSLDSAAQDVQSAIAASLRRLPPGMPNPPTFRKVNPADQPILFLSLNSPTLPLSVVDDYAQTMISQRISMITGVAQVNVMGSQKYAVRAQVDPSLLAARGIDNVMICGVHLNMCVLGRPFAIRQMVTLGKNVVLIRDMTDTMYNPEKEPKVSHFSGTDLVIEHVEKYWCPSILSTDITGKAAFRFKDAK